MRNLRKGDRTLNGFTIVEVELILKPNQANRYNIVATCQCGRTHEYKEVIKSQFLNYSHCNNPQCLSYTPGKTMRQRYTRLRNTIKARAERNGVDVDYNWILSIDAMAKDIGLVNDVVHWTLFRKDKTLGYTKDNVIWMQQREYHLCYATKGTCRYGHINRTELSRLAKIPLEFIHHRIDNCKDNYEGVIEAYYKSETKKKKKKKDPVSVGKKIGLLTLEKEIPAKTPGRLSYVCVCECGTRCTRTRGHLIRYLNLKNKGVPSCGCNEINKIRYRGKYIRYDQHPMHASWVRARKTTEELRWGNFLKFLEDIEYDDYVYKGQLRRINPTLPYGPDNFYWNGLQSVVFVPNWYEVKVLGERIPDYLGVDADLYAIYTQNKDPWYVFMDIAYGKIPANNPPKLKLVTL